MSHSPAHEETILAHVFGTAPEPGDDAAPLAHQLADCDDCLAFAVGLFDDTCALHDLARSRMIEASPPRLGYLQRLDLLLDDVMILRAHRGEPPTSPTSGEEHGERAIPVGTSERS